MLLSTRNMYTAFLSVCGSSDGEFWWVSIPPAPLGVLSLPRCWVNPGPISQTLSKPWGGLHGWGGGGRQWWVLEPSTQCWSIPGVTLGALSCGHFLSLLRLCPWVRIDQWLQSRLWNQNPSSKAQLFLLLCDLGNLLHFFSTQFLFLGADKCSSFSWLTGLWPSYASVSFFAKWC